MKMRKWFKIAIVVAMGAALLIVVYRLNTSVVLRDDFAGTFSSGSGPDAVYLSIAPADHEFYFTDQNNDYYIKGSFERCENGNYVFSCDGPNNKETIPDQEVTYADKAFSFTINGQEYTFEKIQQTPTLWPQTYY